MSYTAYNEVARLAGRAGADEEENTKSFRGAARMARSLFLTKEHNAHFY